MSRVVILGAGISGHTAAMHLRRKLSKKHEVCVISPNSNYQWVPSNIWVGIGRNENKAGYIFLWNRFITAKEFVTIRLLPNLFIRRVPLTQKNHLSALKR